MPVVRWLLVVYRLPPHHARLHTELDRRVSELGPTSLQRSTSLVPDAPRARTVLIDLMCTVENRGGTLIILQSVFLAGEQPETR